MKRGRPKHGNDHDGLVNVGFRADAETLTAIEFLSAVMERQSGVIPSKSMVIRHYLIESARQLYAKVPTSEATSSPVAAGTSFGNADEVRPETIPAKRSKKKR